jgi:hypothetical protein
MKYDTPNEAATNTQDEFTDEELELPQLAHITRRLPAEAEKRLRTRVGNLIGAV